SNPNEHPEARKALIDYGRSFGKLIEDFDDDIGLDGPDWFVRHPNTGFYNKGVLQVNTGEVIDLFQEHRNFRIILNKFVDSGDFKNFENELHLYRSVYGTDGHGNLLIYSFDPSTAKSVGHLDYAAGLEHAANNISNVWAKLDNGESIRVTPQSLKFIQSRVTKNIELFQGNWSPVGVVTPEEFASRIANGRVRSNFTKAGPNMDQMLDMLRERNWISRRYFNALDKLMAQEDELLRTYFTVRGGLKWTAYPFTYWWAKKGFGAESISFYQVPDTWSDILIKHGTEKIFDYSYIDFFANAGSDQGDMFVQVLNYLPWEVIYEQLVENFAPDSVAKLYKQLTGEQMRNEVENIAFYLTGPSNCANCFLKIESDGEFKNFRPFFVVKNTKLSSYILEDTQSTAAKEKGQTLIAFAHKMNLEGKSGGAEGEPIDLVEAERNESKPDEEKPDVEEEVESCKEAIKSLPGYSTANKILSFINLGLPEDEKIAAVLGGAQTLTYGVFFWPGIFSSVLVQTVYAPKLHGCIDTKEGYFVHYFLGAKKEEKVSKEGNKVELSTEKFSNLATKLKDSLFGPFEGDTDNAVQQNTQKLIGEVNKLVKNAEENRVVQAKLDVSGTTAAQLKGINLSYIWCGPGCQRLAGQYRLEGRETVEDKNSKKKIDFNFKNGTLTENGKALVSNPDAVRLSALNTTIPAHEIPNRLYEMCIEPTKEVAIEISANGVANVRSLGARQCLSDAVANQTGLPIGSPDRLSDSFGLVQSVSTVTHPNISFLGDQIIAEGVPRKIAAGAGASLKILNNRKSSLSHSNDGVTDTGTVKAVQFENGQLIVLPNGCYSVWLRHHNGAILNQEDVTGLKPKLTSSYNEETQCEEPALELSALANPESSFLRGKVENFNTSLQKMGPFQIFETPAKRYVLYAEKDEKGECRDHLKEIDKETGKVEDFVGKVSATSDGVKITTPDGREHSLDFSAPNGVPQVSFDDKKPEILTSAQGKNGSFYYDPNTGLWYAENAQLLPLIEAFREGIATKVGPNNTTTSTASGNVLNLQFDEDKGGLLNLPSLPENKWLLLAFAGALLLAITVVRIRFSGKNLNAKN
ncbi:MAG: hypothetical protein HYW50_03330, partial [Candidatus Diapherotrites archaeon]|nr:hypothetical protein [Candidatus Diapherotrites archaeon]